jgi:hypothetical protein
VFQRSTLGLATTQHPFRRPSIRPSPSARTQPPPRLSERAHLQMTISRCRRASAPPPPASSCPCGSMLVADHATGPAPRPIAPRWKSSVSTPLYTTSIRVVGITSSLVQSRLAAHGDGPRPVGQRRTARVSGPSSRFSHYTSTGDTAVGQPAGGAGVVRDDHGIDRSIERTERAPDLAEVRTVVRPGPPSKPGPGGPPPCVAAAAPGGGAVAEADDPPSVNGEPPSSGVMTVTAWPSAVSSPARCR